MICTYAQSWSGGAVSQRGRLAGLVPELYNTLLVCHCET